MLLPIDMLCGFEINYLKKYITLKKIYITETLVCNRI